MSLISTVLNPIPAVKNFFPNLKNFLNPAPAPIGVKTQSQNDSIKVPANTTPQPKKISSPNLSVLAQQKALNAQGAGLKEDGILGPLTQAAIDKNKNVTQSSVSSGTNTIPEIKSSFKPEDSGLYGKLVTELANRSNQSSPEYQAAQGEAQRVSEEQKKLAEDYAKKTNNIAGTAGFLTQQSGLQGQLNNQYNTVQNALSSQYSGATNRLGAANTQQGLLQSLLQSATGAAQPTGNIINVNPITGLPVAGGSLGELAKTAGQVQGIQSGAAANAAAGGQVEAQNKIALGTAPTQASAHSITDFTNQINTTQKSVDTLKGLANAIIPNMGTTGFNPTSSPIGNQTFQTYFTEKNPAAKAGITQGLTEVKNQISNVIASATGLTPTGVTEATNEVDLTTLNPEQLNDFLLYIDKYAQTNMEAANKNIQRIQSGGAVDANTGALPVPVANSTEQAALGTGGKLAAGLISRIYSKAGDVISGMIGGGIVKGGTAKSVLQ